MQGSQGNQERMWLGMLWVFKVMLPGIGHNYSSDASWIDWRGKARVHI